MKKSLIFFLFNIFYWQLLISYNQPHLATLLDRYKKNISAKNEFYGKTIHKAIGSFQQLVKNANPHIILHQSSIKNLFTLAPEKSDDSTFNENLKHLQEVMLVFLYAKIFNEYITQAEIIAQRLSDSLHYWEQEKFYDTLPTIRKHPTYWYHSPAYKKLTKLHVQALKKIEYDICELLGIALHGLHTLNQIKTEDNLSAKLQEGILPLHNHFEISQNLQEFDSLNLLENVTELNFHIQNRLKICEKKLNEHLKPSHFIRHGFLYSCVALTAIAGYTTYQQNEAKIPEYKQKSIETWQYFVQEYVKAPLHKFKQIIWDKKTLELEMLDSIPEIPLIEKLEYTDDDKLKLQITGSLFGTKLPADATITIPSISVTKEENKVIELLNDLIANHQIREKKILHSAKQFIKDQQLTIACAAMIPTALIAWFGYYTLQKTYNKYIKRESWYKPMQRLIRDMDKILNKLTNTAGPSYYDDGVLHLLTLRLKSFIPCLDNEVLILMRQDLAEIGAYHLSYEQKRGVLERMYKTYDFLK